jgi:hypothetical protein
MKQVARLYGAAFMKAASVGTAVNGLMTSETLGSSHWVQTFFQIGCFSHWKQQTDRLQKSLLTQHIWLSEMFLMMLIFPHVRIQGCPHSLLVKSQELPEFSQTGMKPLSIYHHKIPSASHKK